MTCGQKYPPPINYVASWAPDYERAVKEQILAFGEWMRVIDITPGDPETIVETWVFAQFLGEKKNVNLGGIEVEVSDRASRIRGWNADFDPALRKFKRYNSQSSGRGSMIDVRGVRYQVQDIQRNPWGELRAEMVLNDCDAPVDQTFFDDLEQMIEDCENVSP